MGGLRRCGIDMVVLPGSVFVDMVGSFGALEKQIQLKEHFFI